MIFQLLQLSSVDNANQKICNSTLRKSKAVTSARKKHTLERNIISILKNLTLGMVPDTWSKCESSFCVNSAWIDMSINNQYFAVRMDRQLPLHMKRWSPMLIPGARSMIDIERINSISLSMWIVNRRSLILGGRGCWELCTTAISVRSTGL